MEIAKFEFSLFGINSYVVSDPATRKCAFIDPGMSNATEVEAMERYVERKDLKPEYVIATHLHVDHVAGIRTLQEKYGIPLLAHEADAFLGERAADQARMFGIPMKVDGVKISKIINAGDEIEIGEGKLYVIHVPGHSPGRVALYDKKDGFVITGAALFRGSIGRTDLPGGDSATLLKSIREGLFKLPEDTVVYPGHGPATTIGVERHSNPFFA